VARSFSGDKAQLVPLLKAGLSHRGFAIIDVISPCVTFNDHEGSTKSYLNTRKKMLPVIAADFVPPAAEITTEYAPGSAVSVQLHDGSTVRLRKLAEDYDTGNRQAAADEIERHRAKGEVATGLFFLDTKSRDMHEISGTTDVPLSQVPFEKLCPGSAALDELQKSFR
jgi:2-oxoglutarate/2-oxoacid ferredoxin oxidoreductase subunit beta